MRRWFVWLVGVVLLVAAWGVVQVTPDDDIAEAPFVVSATIGRQADARSFIATVTDARLGDAAVSGGWRAEGKWLVVDLEVQARSTEVIPSFDGAVLVVDGLTIRASERPDSLFETSLRVGIPKTGSLAFELPASVSDSTAMLRLSGDYFETRLDSVIEVPIDLAAIEHTDEVELLPTGWARS